MLPVGVSNRSSSIHFRPVLFMVPLTSLVEDVKPFSNITSNSTSVILRFECTDEKTASKLVDAVLDEEYIIHIAIHSPCVNEVATNSVCITANQCLNAFNETSTNGSKGTKPNYICRNQGSKFSSQFAGNVHQTIVFENPNVDQTLLTKDAVEIFMKLFDQVLSETEKVELSVDAHKQIWDSDDLRPDKISHEMNKLYTYNEKATRDKNDSNKYYNVNYNNSSESSSSSENTTNVNVKAKVGFYEGAAGFSMSNRNNQNHRSHNQGETTTHEIISQDAVRHRIAQDGIEIEWNGEKIQSKSFSVYKLSNIAKVMQIAVGKNELTAKASSNVIHHQVKASDLYQEPVPTNPVVQAPQPRPISPPTSSIVDCCGGSACSECKKCSDWIDKLHDKRSRDLPRYLTLNPIRYYRLSDAMCLLSDREAGFDLHLCQCPYRRTYYD